MRLIDADALPVLHLAGWDGETLDMVSKAAIDAAPTAQPTAQERLKGNWISAAGTSDGNGIWYGDNQYRCSCCGQVSFAAYDDPFCRRCGHPMVTLTDTLGF